MSGTPDEFLPPPGRGVGEGWSGRVRLYLWADRDPRATIDDEATPGRPAPDPHPTRWGEEPDAP